MRKSEELTNPTSCMSRAREDEMTFVLLGRDVAAPATIRHWVAERIRQGKNDLRDPQIREALECAATMEQEAELVRLIEQAREHYRLHPPTQENLDQHIISFAYGNVHLSNPSVTREMVEQEWQKLKGKV